MTGKALGLFFALQPGNCLLLLGIGGGAPQVQTSSAGHSDPDMVPVEAFIESAANVFRGDPRNIFHVQLRRRSRRESSPLRQFLVDKLAIHRGINTTIEDVLITSGSGLAIELINEILLEEGDTVIVEAFSFSGALGNIRRRKVNMIGIDVDHDGMSMDQLAAVLADLRDKGCAPQVHLYDSDSPEPHGHRDVHGAPVANAGAERGVRSPRYSKTNATPASYLKANMRTPSALWTTPTGCCI